jgi:hypothetical protein
MTGKEYLLSKSEEDLYDTMVWLFETYGRSYTDTRSAIIGWLKTEGATDKFTCKYNGKEIVL